MQWEMSIPSIAAVTRETRFEDNSHTSPLFAANLRISQAQLDFIHRARTVSAETLMIFCTISDGTIGELNAESMTDALPWIVNVAKEDLFSSFLIRHVEKNFIRLWTTDDSMAHATNPRKTVISFFCHKNGKIGCIVNSHANQHTMKFIEDNAEEVEISTICVGCGMIVDGRLKCAACRAYYCGKECQRATWAIHKHHCERAPRAQFLDE